MAETSAPAAPAAPAETSAPAAPPSVADTITGARDRVAGGGQLIDPNRTSSGGEVVPRDGGVAAPAKPAETATPASPAAPATDEGGAAAIVSPSDTGAGTALPDFGEIDWANTDVAELEKGHPGLLVIPPRRRGDAPVPVTISDPAIVEDMRRWRNDGMRGAEYADARADLEEREENVMMAQAMMEADPVSFVLNNMDEADAAQVAMTVLTHPEVWPHMTGTIQQMIDDPAALEIARSRLMVQQNQMHEQAERQVRLQQAVRRNIGEVRHAIHALTPGGLTRPQASLWRDAAQQAVKEYAGRNQLNTVEVRDIPAILASHLAAFDVAPEEAWARMRAAFTNQQETDRNGASPGSAATIRKVPGQPDATSRRLDSRAAAASIAPAGAGAPAAQIPTPPEGQTVKERIEWLRKNPGTLRPG